MKTLDIIILLLYMGGIILLGVYLGRKNESGEEYFNGGRSMPWYALGLSVGLTMISANSFIGGPGWGYHSGMMAAMVNISIPLCIAFCTYTILPVIYHAKVTTVYEYVNMRLGPKTRILNVVIWSLQSMIFIGGFVYTPSLVLEAITNIDMNVWIPVIMVITIIMTIIGGIKAVIWTDMIQGIVLFVGLLISIYIAINKIDMPLSQILDIARDNNLTQSFDFTFDKDTLNVFCVFIGGAAMWMGYFGFDQGQVQRYISAKDMRTIKKTGVMSTLSMQFIYWLCFLLGIILFVFYKKYDRTLDFGNANNVMTDFLINHVQSGILGILLSATFAATMSSINSVLNSLTAVFVKDIYEPYIVKKTGTTLKQSMIFTTIFGVIIILFVYLYLGDNTASILQTIGTYVAPFGALLTGMMIVCCFMPSANDNGVFIGALLAGIISFYISEQYSMYYLWTYFYGSVLCILLSWICSKFFYSEKEAREKYKYTIYGTIKSVKGRVDHTGSSVEPLKFDRYAYIMVAIMVVQCIVLFMIE